MRVRSPRFGFHAAAAALVVLVPLAACGGGDAATTDSLAADTAAATAAAAAPAAPAAPAGAAGAPITAADLDAYGRALAAEIEVLREAVARRDAARSASDTLAALSAASEHETVPAAARRAGLDPQRYRALDAAFGRALGARVQNPGMRQMMSQADTSYLRDLPAAQAEQARATIRESMRQMEAAFGDSATYASVPAELRDAFRQRADESLEALWRDRFTLRARAAGLAR